MRDLVKITGDHVKKFSGGVVTIIVRYPTYKGIVMSAVSSKLSAKVSQALSDEEVRRCWAVFSELRPDLTEVEFIRRWKVQHQEGYEIVFIESDNVIVAAAGFRYINTMAWGKILYLDDLIALRTQQGHGWGSALLRWLQEQARVQRCEAVHLDTGYNRQAAHKAYLRNGFELNCHHLAWKVSRPST
jgi:GNAT superfamily N-acetyltransferase